MIALLLNYCYTLQYTMKKITLLLFVFSFFLNFYSFGEGTGQLNPPLIPITTVPMATAPVARCNATRLTQLVIWNEGATGNSYTYQTLTNGIAQNVHEKRLQFHVENSTTEMVYIGLRAEAGYEALHYRIVDPLGNIVVNSTPFPTAGNNGYIADYARAAYGPNGTRRANDAAVGTNGYTPIIFDPTMTGDYWIEFNVGLTANTTLGIIRLFRYYGSQYSSSTPNCRR